MPRICLAHTQVHHRSVHPRFTVLAASGERAVHDSPSHGLLTSLLTRVCYLLSNTYLLLTAYSAAMARATLVVSYWSAPSSNLSWFDQPPCEAGGRGQDACGETVRLSKLSLRPGPFKTV